MLTQIPPVGTPSCQAGPVTTGGLEPGLYEHVMTVDLAARLAENDPGSVNHVSLLAGEIPDRLALLVGELVERALRGIPETDRSSAGTTIVQSLIEQLAAQSQVIDSREQLSAPLNLLTSVDSRTPAGSWHRTSRPLTPLLDTTLLTGAPGEPTLLSQIQSEIPSAMSISAVVAFIRHTGVWPLLGLLRDHVARGRPLRFLTTTYTGSTEQRALDALAEIGAEVRVSYDVGSTRLHAKSWVFGRPNGVSTAYVGSSNMTHQAQVSGLEWNVRVSERRNALVLEKLAAVFDSYWEGGDFVPYDPEEFSRRTEAVRRPPVSEWPLFDVTPHPFQRRMLEQLAVARAAGFHRNLVVAATGTGKTVLAALDYKRLRGERELSRLLFVAHRQEILEQTLRTFRAVLRDPTFGELWVGGQKPREFNHVFASIQSLSARAPDSIAPNHFDIVIVDEFHHAAASSYDRLLSALTPGELLGLTATPERTDGRSVLHWFADRIAVELRLWDAIDQQRLVPFLYFGVDDGSDLSCVGRRGREYIIDELDRVYTANTQWVERVIRETARLADVETMVALGFCASVAHAEFTAAAFSRAGIAAEVLTGETPQVERSRILGDLRAGRVRVVFSVDVLGEGVDLPEVDTILMMRPTESATVFLQQLGRGLRRHEGKSACLVLDFMGQQVDDFRFDLKYRALMSVGRQQLATAIASGFPHLPVGCQLNLEPIPARRILESLKKSLPSTWRLQANELAKIAQRGDVSLADYLRETGLDASDVYHGDRSWMALRDAAGLPIPTAGPHNAALRRAIARMTHVDDPVRLLTYAQWLSQGDEPQPVDVRGQRLLRMLVASLIGSIRTSNDGDLAAAAKIIWSDENARADLAALIGALRADSVMSRDAILPLAEVEVSPLQLHARYTRIEILAAVGAHPDVVVPPSWQSGVWFEQSVPVDLLAFTLDKSDGSFSPTTRYRDYAISDSLIHWESQSVTREGSETGQRYIHHRELGSAVWLFARATRKDRFWFLGPASYVSHYGERPMAITWRLDTPLPESLYAAMAAAVA